MVRRSLLFTPGDRPDRMRTAARTDADVLCFDLEDAVAPSRKTAARTAVREVLSDPAFDPDAEVVVRVAADAAAADLDGVLGRDGEANVRLDAVMLPKVGFAADVRDLDDELAARGWTLPVFALVETARGVVNAVEIAAEGPTTALVFGAEDLAADLGATRTEGGTEVLYARQRVVVAAAAEGIDAIDTVHTDLDDEDGLREQTGFARTLGYDGKLVVHPAQVPVVNEAFTPDPERVEWARKVLRAREEAGEDAGVFRVDDEMIDAPLLAQAERTLELAESSDGG